MAFYPAIDITHLAALASSVSWRGAATGMMVPRTRVLTSPTLTRSVSWRGAAAGMMTPRARVLTSPETLPSLPWRGSSEGAARWTRGNVIWLGALPPSAGHPPLFDPSVEIFINLTRYFYPASRARLFPEATARPSHARIVATGYTGEQARRRFEILKRRTR